MATVPDIADVDRLDLFTAIASQVNFSVTWPVFGTSDADAMTTLRVTVDGVEETDWTFVGTIITNLTGVFDGGTITRPVALTGGEAIVIWSDGPAKRDSDFIEGASFPATTQDRVLNRIFANQRDDQQRREAVVRRPFDETTLDMKLPTVALRAGKYFGWGPTGLPVAVGDATTLGGVTLVDLAAFDGSSLIGYKQGGAGSVITTVELKLQERPSVKDFGAVGDGVTSDSTPIAAADALSVQYLFSEGNYYHDGIANPTIANMVMPEGSFIFGLTDKSSVTTRDRDGNFIGIHHNYLETKKDSPGPTPAIVQGAFVSPPISTAQGGAVDIAAYWFNQFGIEWIRDGNGVNGNVAWYTWEWNHKDSSETDGHEQDRHPLLGWYRGDDPVVLDWQCYWLKEAGVTAIILIGKDADYSAWATATTKEHWKFQLFTAVPNFQGLKYILPIVYDGLTFPGLADLKTEFDLSITTILSVYENAYTIQRDGKRYVVFFIWDSGELRTITDNLSGATNLKAFLKYVADQVITLGYDGAAFLTRNASTTATLSNQEGVVDNWIYMLGDYGNVYGADQTTTFQNIVDTFGDTVPANYEIIVPNIMTARDSHSFHPSTFPNTGHTPALFRELVQKAVRLVGNQPEQHPNLITIYNVAEWAEGGPSLQPNMQDNFGYMDALRAGLQQGIAEIKSDTVSVLTGAGGVDIITPITHIVTTSADALTLADGFDGQKISIVMKTDGGVGTLTPTNLANGSTITFDDVGDSAFLEFTNGAWHWLGGTATLDTSAYTRAATVVEDRALLASASATATNNNNVLAALIADLQTKGIIS